MPAQERYALCVTSHKRPARFLIGGQPRCLRCTLKHGPMLRRSLLTALVVGTILTAINQGTALLDGNLPASLAWKVPLTYAVPFCVATWGALVNSRL
jgi:hypothetical protein